MFKKGDTKNKIISKLKNMDVIEVCSCEVINPQK